MIKKFGRAISSCCQSERNVMFVCFVPGEKVRIAFCCCGRRNNKQSDKTKEE